jgi:hypothetical protein
MKIDGWRGRRGVEGRTREPQWGEQRLTLISIEPQRRGLLAEARDLTGNARVAGNRALAFSIWAGLVLSLALACSAVPPSRMDAYLNPSAQEATGVPAKPTSPQASALTVGLLVINDTTAGDSAPPLSPEGLTVFTDQVRTQITQQFPINIEKVLPSTGFVASSQAEQFVLASREAGVAYLLLVLLSSTEMESPATFEVEAGSQSLEGTTTQNFSLVEIALLDGRTGAVLMRAEGREWARLNRLNAGAGAYNYPTITRDDGRRLSWWQIRDPYEALRVSIGVEALKETLVHFERAWKKVFSE